MAKTPHELRFDMFLLYMDRFKHAPSQSKAGLEFLVEMMEYVEKGKLPKPKEEDLQLYQVFRKNIDRSLQHMHPTVNQTYIFKYSFPRQMGVTKSLLEFLNSYCTNFGSTRRKGVYVHSRLMKSDDPHFTKRLSSSEVSVISEHKLNTEWFKHQGFDVIVLDNVETEIPADFFNNNDKRVILDVKTVEHLKNND